MKSAIANNNLSVIASSHPQQKEITLLSAKGFIDTTTAPEFDRIFQTALSEKKFNLIIDLKEVTYISSAGWGLFVGEIKRIRNQKGNLFLAAMKPEVEDAYELLQFGTIIKSFPSVQEALQKGFGKSGKEASANPSTGSGPKGAKRGTQPSTLTATPLTAAEEPSPAPQPRQKPRLIHLFMPWKWF